MLIEAIKGIDHGGYYFFRHKAQHHPDFVPIMQAGDWLGSLWVVALLMALALLLFVARGSTRAALVALLFFVFGIVLVEALRYLVPGKRPEDAQNLLGGDEMLRSFPARSVFLVTLAGALLVAALWRLLDGAILRVAMAAGVALLVVWVSLSQLFLGLHFVTDVVAGLAGGLALALLCSRFLPAEPDKGVIVRPR